MGGGGPPGAGLGGYGISCFQKDGPLTGVGGEGFISGSLQYYFSSVCVIFSL